MAVHGMVEPHRLPVSSMLDLIPTAIPDLLILSTRWFEDERGAFSEVFNLDRWDKAGLATRFTQDAQSLSRPRGTLRGMHFQAPPMAQTKIVRVVRGAIWDVAVDLRVGSPTFGEWVGVELSHENRRQLYIPIGFAHGYVSLTPDAEMIYKLGNPYSPEHERGVAWDDPALGIQWPLDGTEPVMAERDRRWPRLSELPDYFHYVP